jgi:hypothetical protein
MVLGPRIGISLATSARSSLLVAVQDQVCEIPACVSDTLVTGVPTSLSVALQG